MEGTVHGKLQNGEHYSIRGKRYLPNVLTLSHLQIKRCARKDHQVFFIHLREDENETKDNEFDTERVKIILKDFKDVFHEHL